MLKNTNSKALFIAPDLTNVSSFYKAKVIGLQPVLEQETLYSKLFPLRLLVIISKELIAGELVPVYNEQANNPSFMNAYFLEHIVQAKEGSISLNGSKPARNEDLWMQIARLNYTQEKIDISEAIITTKLPEETKFTKTLVYKGGEVMIRCSSLYQRKRKSDGKPFQNKMGEEMWHTRYLTVDSLGPRPQEAA